MDGLHVYESGEPGAPAVVFLHYKGKMPWGDAVYSSPFCQKVATAG